MHTFTNASPKRCTRCANNEPAGSDLEESGQERGLTGLDFRAPTTMLGRSPAVVESNIAD